MTEIVSEPRLFRDPFMGGWYCWDKEWAICHGPFGNPSEAQEAAGYDKFPPNCS